MLEVSILESVCYPYGKKHNIYSVLCIMTGSTLAFNFIRICFLPPHPDVAFPSIGSLLVPCLWQPILLLLDFCISASTPFIPSGCPSFFFSLIFPHTHFQFFVKKNFLLSFPHMHLIITVLSYCHLCKEPHECSSTSTAQYFKLKPIYWQELRQQISITLITNCSMKLKENPN